MNTKRSTASAGAALALAVVLACGPATGQELLFSIIGGPKHVVNAVITPEWADTVKKATQGRVTIKILPAPVAAPPRLYDAVRTSVVDSASIMNAFLVKKAPLIQLA